MTGQIRVLVAEDAALVRASLRMLLDAEPDIAVIGEAVDGVEAVDEAVRTDPDVVLMDLGMPRRDGTEATRLVCRDTRARVVVLTAFDDDASVFGALRAGASGFLLKSASPGELAGAVRTVAGGESLLDPRVTARIVAQAVAAHPGESANRPTGPAVAGLDERSRALLVAVGRGLSNTEIAAELGYTAATVKTYVSRLAATLGARDRAQLVIAAYESGLLRRG